jgi:hypothetical protein
MSIELYHLHIQRIIETTHDVGFLGWGSLLVEYGDKKNMLKYLTEYATYAKQPTINTDLFFSILRDADKTRFVKRCEFLFRVYGTRNRCNRFDIGNCIELFLSDLMTTNGIPNTQQTHPHVHVPCYGSLARGK